MFDSLPARIILSAFFTLSLAAFFLYHFMVFKVNQHLDPGEQFPHSLSFGQREQLRDLYKSLYPWSPIYRFAVICGVGSLLLAVAFAAYRIWDIARSLTHS
jgi:hypothetical protein